MRNGRCEYCGCEGPLIDCVLWFLCPCHAFGHLVPKGSQGPAQCFICKKIIPDPIEKDIKRKEK